MESEIKWVILNCVQKISYIDSNFKDTIEDEKNHTNNYLCVMNIYEYFYE